jgi:hypothetical protein
VSSPATAAPACVGAAVAAIMAARGLCLLSGEAPSESREIAFDLRHNRFLESRLRRSPRCRFDHGVVPEVIPVASEARVGDLLGLIERRFGTAPVHLEGPRFVGQAFSLPAQDGRLKACSTDGFAPARFLAAEALRPRAGEPLAALGIGPGSGMRVRCGGASVFVILQS